MHAVLQAGGDSGPKNARIERGAVTTGVPSSTADDRRPEPGHRDGAGAGGGEVVDDVPVPPSECASSGSSENFSRLPSVQEGTAEGQKKGPESGGEAAAVDMWSSLVAVLEVGGASRRRDGWSL